MTKFDRKIEKFNKEHKNLVISKNMPFFDERYRGNRWFVLWLNGFRVHKAFKNKIELLEYIKTV